MKKSAINNFVPVASSSSHPGKLERIKAIEVGYNSAKSIENITIENSTIKVSELRRPNLNSKNLYYSKVKSRISYLLKDCQIEMNKSVINPKYKINLNLAYDLYNILSSVNNDLTFSERREYTADLKSFEDHINNYAILAFTEQNYDVAYLNFAASLDISEILNENNVISRLGDKTIWEEQIYYTAVSAYFSNKYKNESIKYFEELSYKQYSQPMVYEALFTHYCEMDVSKAFIYLENGRKLFPLDNGLIFAEINYYLKVGQLDILTSKLKKAIEREPDNISVYTTLGNVYDQLNQKERTNENIIKADEYFKLAQSYFEQALSKDSKNFDAVYSLGAIYYNMAASMTIKLNALGNDYSQLGTKKYNSIKDEMDGHFNRALPYFLRAEKLDPNDQNTMVALKEIYTRKDDISKANYYRSKLAR